jgi:hypothetical protein
MKIEDTLKKYRDSNSQTEKTYIKNLRKMGGEKRLKVGFSLYEMALNLCKSNIINNNPGISELELRKKLLERFGYDPGRYTDQYNKKNQ